MADSLDRGYDKPDNSVLKASIEATKSIQMRWECLASLLKAMKRKRSQSAPFFMPDT